MAERVDDDFARLAAGDRAAARPVFDALWPRVRAYCATLVGDADADDAAQQAIVTLFSRAGDYDPDRGVIGWALAIAWWRCRAIRTQRGRSRVVDDQVSPETADNATPADEWTDARARSAALRAAIADLPAADREVIELTLAELAPSDGTSPEAFRKRRQRAVARLRAWFAQLYPLEP